MILRPSDYILTVFTRTPDKNGIAVLEEVNLSITVSSEQCSIQPDRLGLIAPTLKWQQANSETKV